MKAPEIDTATTTSSVASRSHKPGCSLRHYALTTASVLLLLLWGATAEGCSREAVESPEHTSNRPYTPDDGNKKTEEEAIERVNAMLVDATLRIDTPSGVLRYANDGVLFMESTDGLILEAHDLATAQSVRLKAPVKLQSIVQSPVMYPNIISLETVGWQLTVNGSDVELHSLAMMQADEQAVWLRLRTPNAHFYWVVIPREW